MFCRGRIDETEQHTDTLTVSELWRDPKSRSLKFKARNLSVGIEEQWGGGRNALTTWVSLCGFHFPSLPVWILSRASSPGAGEGSLDL